MRAGRALLDPADVQGGRSEVNLLPASERGAPFTTAGFARMIERAGKVAIQGPPAHAQACLRLCVGEQRHQGASGLSRPSQLPAHGAVYRTGADACGAVELRH
jgi:hypothetical protein